MRKRDLRTGLVVQLTNGERGVTELYDGELVIQFHSVWGGEGYSPVRWYRPRDIKILFRVYDPKEKS